MLSDDVSGPIELGGVHIKDNGRGFDVEEAISSKERLELFNGTLSIRSRPGNGPEIDIEIPINLGVSNE